MAKKLVRNQNGGSIDPTATPMMALSVTGNMGQINSTVLESERASKILQSDIRDSDVDFISNNIEPNFKGLQGEQIMPMIFDVISADKDNQICKLEGQKLGDTDGSNIGMKIGHWKRKETNRLVERDLLVACIRKRKVRVD